MSDRPDVVVCGAGIAGGALAAGLARNGVSVLVLEQLEEHRDLLRGEMLSPWGIDAAVRLGVDDCIFAADPQPLNQWVQWDECFPADEAPVVDLTRRFVAGVASPLAIRYGATAASLAQAARAAGAQIIMGARDIKVAAGEPPTVTYVSDGVSRRVQPRLVVGAGGRHGPIGRQVGLRLDVDAKHWGAGCIVEGLDEWPVGVHAMGTEGHRMFFVFPHGGGRARLYLNFAAENMRRYAGPGGTRVFLDDFALRCLPRDLSEMCVASTAITPCGSVPQLRTRLARPFADGVVLIGDEAGTNDAVLGTGLSSALDDARRIAHLLLENESWNSTRFEQYARRRAQRQEKLHFAAEFYSQMFCEFGPEAAARRGRALARMSANPNYAAIMLVPLAGPDRTPPFAFSDLLVERLFAEEAREQPATRRRFALIG